jgi:synaptic vesicle membrane protein VAT-1
MRKVVIHSPGGYEKLRIEEHLDPPAPAGSDLLVRIRAAGVNYADCCVRWGVYESARKYVGWPITPGFEFAGTVEAAGPRVSGPRVGDEVVGICRFGAYASHVVVPARHVFRIPRGFTPEQAAAFPAVHLTAYHALFQNLRLRPGMSLLVHSAAGGVGSALVQLGKLAGCRVVAVVGSSHKVDHARRLGADAVIDKSREDLWARARQEEPAGYDVVLDANGHSTLRGSYRSLRPTGKLVAYGFHSMLPRQGGRIRYLKAAWGLLRTPRFSPLRMTNENKSLIAFNLSFLFDRDDLLEEGIGDLCRWAEEGTLRPPQVSTFRLEDVAQAHRAIESGQTVGKLVLLP